MKSASVVQTKAAPSMAAGKWNWLPHVSDSRASLQAWIAVKANTPNAKTWWGWFIFSSTILGTLFLVTLLPDVSDVYRVLLYRAPPKQCGDFYGHD